MDPDNPSQPRTTPGAAIPRSTNHHCSAPSTIETIPTTPPVTAAPAGAGNTTTAGGCAVVAARTEVVLSHATHRHQLPLSHDDDGDSDDDSDVGQEIGDTGLVYDDQGDLK